MIFFHKTPLSKEQSGNRLLFPFIKKSGNHLIFCNVRTDTDSFPPRGYPPHEKSTAFPDCNGITPLSQTRCLPYAFPCLPEAFSTRRFVIAPIRPVITAGTPKACTLSGMPCLQVYLQARHPDKNRCFASARRIVPSSGA